MEEVERLADHIVIIDHGKVIANETPAALYRRLPVHAAMVVDLPQPASAELLNQVGELSGVANVMADGQSVHIGLADIANGLPVLQWMASHGHQPLHYATAKSNLEDIFLTLTGRTLRD
jgi:ABC-2 type transport system ATP-binding protein